MSGYVERFSLTDRVALVTGASKGIGFALCPVLAEAGADIVAVARDVAGLAEVMAVVEAKGRRCLAVEADLASVDAPAAAARAALDAFGAVHVLVNNAGIARNAPLVEATLADWELTMAVNLRAPFLLAQALAPQMIARGAGKIINVSSQTSSIVALDDHGAYAASKGGLNALTKVMCCEWARHNIQCNAVNPTVILTPMGEQVWGPPEKGGADAGQDPRGPLRQASRGRRRDPVPGLVGLGHDQRRDDPHRRRVHGRLTAIAPGRPAEDVPAGRRRSAVMRAVILAATPAAIVVAVVTGAVVGAVAGEQHAIGARGHLPRVMRAVILAATPAAIVVAVVTGAVVGAVAGEQHAIGARGHLPRVMRAVVLAATPATIVAAVVSRAVVGAVLGDDDRAGRRLGEQFGRRARGEGWRGVAVDDRGTEKADKACHEGLADEHLTLLGAGDALGCTPRRLQTSCQSRSRDNSGAITKC